MLDGRKLELAALTAYEAYRMEVGGKAVNGDDLPRWDGLPERLRVAWRIAADAAVMVAEQPAGQPPSRWRPLAEVLPAEVQMTGPGPFLNTLDPVAVAEYERAHAVAPVEADDQAGAPGERA